MQGDSESIQVSVDGGYSPRWSSNGRQLFYRFADAFYVASVSFDRGSASIGRPRLLFSKPDIDTYIAWDEGFLMATTQEQDPNRVAMINVVFDWLKEVDAAR